MEVTVTHIKRMVCLLLTLVLLCGITPALAAPATAKPTATPNPYPAATLSPDAAPYDPEHPEDLEPEQLYAWSAILVESKSGEVIFAKDPDTRRHPASTTKIMTLMLACLFIPESELEDTTVVSVRAATLEDPEATNMNLQAGEEIRVIDLLYGCAIKSANDAANAIAEYVSGSVEAFVALMNQYAALIGCEDTHFANPHGLTDVNHYTTARDMARIARAAMEVPLFREIVGTYSYALPKTNMNSKRTIYNTNTLFKPSTEENPNKYYYPYAIGIKTGTTDAAQYCFVGAAEKDDVELISVVLYGSGPRGIWADTIKMMDYGFSQYTSVTPIDLYNMNPITIETSNYSLQDSNMGKLALTCRPVNPADAVRANIVATFAEVKAMASNLKKTVIISYVRDFEAPFTAGEVVGTMTFFPDGSEPVEYHLVASRSIGARENAPPSLQEIIDSVMNDPNPLPKLNSRILVSYVVIPIVLIWIIMHFISRLWSMRRHRTSRTPKVVHRHLK